MEYLPLKTVISYVEIDMSELISEETFEYYKREIKEREKNRLIAKQKEHELDKLMPQK